MSSTLSSCPEYVSVVHAAQVTRARASNMRLTHGPVELPIFMPVATQASLKGLTPSQLESTGCRLCLNNTYHLSVDHPSSASTKP